MIRVAALMATEAVSGPGRQLAALVDPLRRRGIELRVVLFQRASVTPSPYARYLEQAGVPVHIVRDRGPLDWRLVGAVRRQLDAMGAALVQTHAYKASAVGYLLRRAIPGERRPWIGFYHGATNKGWRDQAYQWLELRLLRAADRVVVVTREQRSLFPGVDHVRVIHNAAIEIPESSGEEEGGLRVELRERGDGPRLGVVARLSPEKGVDLFLHACAELDRRGQPFSAVVVGDGPESESLRRTSAELGLGGRVRFLGRIDAVKEVYRAIDLLVMPSRSEGLPNVLLEALRADVPVVATRVGAVPDVLTDPAAGLVVPPHDPVALADGVQQALQRSTGPAGTAARAGILGRFSLETRVQEHVDLYRELLPLSSEEADGVAPRREAAPAERRG